MIATFHLLGIAMHGNGQRTKLMRINERYEGEPWSRIVSDVS
jgi:hypothetical protein